MQATLTPDSTLPPWMDEPIAPAVADEFQDPSWMEEPKETTYLAVGDSSSVTQTTSPNESKTMVYLLVAVGVVVVVLGAWAALSYNARVTSGTNLLGLDPSSTCSAVQADTDYFGNDIGKTQRSSPDLCCADCTTANPNLNCVAFVWYNGTCYLKNAVGVPTKSPGRQASLVTTTNRGTTSLPSTPLGLCSAIQPDTDYVAHNIFYTNRPSADQCCGDCAATANCALFVWFNGTCYLKSAGATSMASPGRVASTFQAKLTSAPSVPAAGKDAPVSGSATTPATKMPSSATHAVIGTMSCVVVWALLM
ncbi:Aste57867_1907 [Aphanomyces stellatus]|uniref:Aste57867_1907 protein n=1 Tax=Aphanomyces stellatus TaxID=120398 RepID=A0A485KBH3_9STRA|nr:hypothetical protein As57867_001905 [Aphanomyces stellatus]VFT79113.1 Aste57867_1907 [Aphanomyces stellatus]